MKQIKIVSYLLTIILIGCVGKQEKRYTDCTTFSWEELGSEIMLHGRELELSEELTRPIRISIFDSTLILLNHDSENLVQLINVKQEKEIACYGSFGSGPTDFMNPRYVHKKDSMLFIYDSGLRRFNQYVMGSDSLLRLTESTQFTFHFDDVVMLSDSVLAANVLDPRLKKISFFLHDSLVNTMGDYPQIAGSNDSLNVLAQLEGFSSSLAWNASKRKIALAYKLTDLIEIYDETGILRSRMNGPDHFIPSKTVKDNDDTQKVTANIGEERDAYFSPVATSNELFVLYSGRIYHPGDKSYLLDRLIVFDWDAKPLRQYKLDIPIFRFTIDENGRTLYGITDSPEFRIIRFDLNN